MLVLVLVLMLVPVLMLVLVQVLVAVLALLLLLVCLPSSAAVVFEIETTDLTSVEAQQGRIVVSGKNIELTDKAALTEL